MVVLALTVGAFAQDVNNSVNVGFPTNGVFTGSNFDSVQINNGNLHVTLPMWSVKGRGLDVGYNMIYDSKGWTYDQWCSDQYGICEVMIRPEHGHAMNMPVRGPFDYYLTRKRESTQCTEGTTVGLQLRESYVLREPNGTKHHFVPDPVAPTENNCWPVDSNLYADDTSGWTISGGPVSKSGIRIAVQAEDLQQPFGQLPPAPIQATAITDTNGNSLVGGTTTGTDSLGRAFSTTGLQYVDSSGVSQSIQVTYQNISIDTTPLCAAFTSYYVSVDGWPSRLSGLR
jgi:hypothetical protein